MRKKLNVVRGKLIDLSKNITKMLKFTGNENHDFSLQEASLWTKEYRKLNPGATLAHYFGKRAIQNILNQSGCVGLRIYYAIDPSNGEKHVILVGADANQNDIDQGLIAERCISCPTKCGKSNALNS